VAVRPVSVSFLFVIASTLISPGSVEPNAAPDEPIGAVSPLEAHMEPHSDDSRAPIDGVAPLDPSSGTPLHPGLTQPDEVVAPLDRAASTDPDAGAQEPLDPRKALIVRLDMLVGPVFRIRRVDTMANVGVELGRKHGFSGTFHTEMIVASDRNNVRVFDVPLGVGAVARGRLRNRGLYGSVGLTAGILVHRAAMTEPGTFEDRVIHRVDPDFRLPIGFGWTASSVGVSLAILQGYSVRSRTYERRGAEIWHRHAYRIGLLVGLHFDISTDRTHVRRSGGKRVKR
jgi:hypothetical protein